METAREKQRGVLSNQYGKEREERWEERWMYTQEEQQQLAMYIYTGRRERRSKWVDEGGSLCVCVHRSFTLYIYIGSLIYIYILGIWNLGGSHSFLCFYSSSLCDNKAPFIFSNILQYPMRLYCLYFRRRSLWNFNDFPYDKEEEYDSPNDFGFALIILTRYGATFSAILFGYRAWHDAINVDNWCNGFDNLLGITLRHWPC